MKLSGWGRYPWVESEVFSAYSKRKLSELLADSKEPLSPCIPRGLGRSYGDSALADTVFNTQHLNHFAAFNPETGELTCSAGISLDEILTLFVPRGWFLPVTPGTKFITVGGAIASDVHGKNHHLDGTFGEHVLSLDMMLASGEQVTCSRNQHPELFLATCGGMGLTGIIVQATLKLIPIESAQITEQTYKTRNLEETLERFEQHHNHRYSVAWIDCLSTGKQLGRSLLMLGEHSPQQTTQGQLEAHKDPKLSVPFSMPSLLLNRYSIQAFNGLYYHKQTREHSERQVHYEPFFYPLDSIHHWNRLYGKNGFVQYQFVIPKAAGLEGMTHILKKIAVSKRGSFLAVLKAFGKANDHLLSFPTEGYTLALDFKMDSGLLEFLNELDQIVLDYGGRLYLTKDARMSEATFKQSYPNWEQFQEVRARYGAEQRFQSKQSLRLGL